MESPEIIAVCSQETEELTCVTGEGSSTGTRRNTRRRQSEDRGDFKPGRDPGEGWDGGDGEQNKQTTNGQEQDFASAPEDPSARFYEDYRKVAEQYDREFLKKYDEDLSTTLIFAGLFSAVTSAFIIQVGSQLQPDPNNQTVALLRVLIYKIDNTTFGNDIPALPQWTGPPPAAVEVQAILFASLAASLFSAFLAMLGKQWLNRYASTGMRGSVMEHSQERQRKLDGIVTWYFNHVMEFLPLMLQAALLLLGCALSRYLWDVNTTVASVVIGATSFGAIFYLFIVIAGAIYTRCPYQTPGSRFLRHLRRTVPGPLGSAASVVMSGAFAAGSTFLIAFWKAKIVETHRRNVDNHHPWWSRVNIRGFLKDMVSSYPHALAIDVYSLGRAVARSLVEPIINAYRLGSMLAESLVASSRKARGQFPGIIPVPEQRMNQRMATLDLRCVSWILQTSLDKNAHLSALKHLATVAALPDCNPTLATDCFGFFIGCVNVHSSYTRVEIIQGLEQLATISSLCLLRIISRIPLTDPTSNTLEDIRRRYNRVFPPETDFSGLPFYYTMAAVHSLFKRCWWHRRVEWGDYEPSAEEFLPVAQALVKLAQLEYRRTGPASKVPRWLLRFAIYSLSLDPPPPTSVIADSLSIIAIDLECDISNPVVTTASSDHSTQLEQVWGLITEKLVALTEADDWNTLRRKRKAVAALFPYAVLQEQNGQYAIFDVFLRAVKTTKLDGFMWHRVQPFVSTLLSDGSHLSLKRAVVLASPYIPWGKWICGEDLIQPWAATAFAIPHKKEVAQSVVDALLQIAYFPFLRPYIHADVWSWLTLRPPLPPICQGRRMGSDLDIVQTVRNLKNIEILKCYLLLVWSEWDSLCPGGFFEMCNSIREDFCGIRMGCRRVDLVQRLDHVLRELNRGLEYLRKHRPELFEDDLEERKYQYGELRAILLDEDKKALAQFYSVRSLSRTRG